MLPAPLVSEFTELQSPVVRHSHIVRNRHKFHRIEQAIIYPPPAPLPSHPPQIIVDAGRLQAPSANSGIRGEIDVCLEAVCSAYAEQKLEGDPNDSLIADDAIHRIDTNLIMEYVRTVYKDYGVRNRFGELAHSHVQPQPAKNQQHRRISTLNTGDNIQLRTGDTLTRREERCSSVQRDSSRRKQYLNLTQSSKREKRVPSADRSTLQQTHRQSNSFNSSPSYHQHLHRPSPNDKIPEDFRFCISCERSVLSHNVPYHEQHECQNIQSLYRLPYPQLREVVAQKIGRIRQELRGRLAELKQNGLGNAVAMMERYVDEVDQEMGNDRQKQFVDMGGYARFKESLANGYAQAIELTNKLHWFLQVHAKLSDESLTIQGRPSDLLSRLFKLPRTPKTMLPQTRSPVQYLQGSAFAPVSPFPGNI